MTQPIRRCIENDIANALQTAVGKGESSVSRIVSAWFDNKHKRFIHWATLKAICRRNGGPYTTAKKVKHNLNESVMERYRTHMTPTWDRDLNQIIPTHAPLYVEMVNNALAGFRDALTSSVTEIKPELCPRLSLILSQLPHLDFGMKRNVNHAFDIFAEDGKIINRMPLLCATKKMSPVYMKCSDESGKIPIDRQTYFCVSSY